MGHCVIPHGEGEGHGAAAFAAFALPSPDEETPGSFAWQGGLAAVLFVAFQHSSCSGGRGCRLLVHFLEKKEGQMIKNSVNPEGITK